MAQAYTAPTWTDGSGEGISASNLQAISNALQGIVQGTDKAIHNIAINGSTITFTFVNGTIETAQAVNLKGIVSIDKTGTSGLVDTYTITYTDGTTSTFTVTNGTNSDKADLTLIAPVQTTLTASRAYAVGEQFVYNQVLYKVTQAIASGATITIGTNAVEAGSITEQQHKVYPVDGAGIVITNNTKEDPFTLPSKSIVRLVTEANEEAALAVVKKDKSDWLRTLSVDSGTHPRIVTAIVLDAGTMVYKWGSGTGSKLYYAPLEY